MLICHDFIHSCKAKGMSNAKKSDLRKNELQAKEEAAEDAALSDKESKETSDEAMDHKKSKA